MAYILEEAREDLRKSRDIREVDREKSVQGRREDIVRRSTSSEEDELNAWAVLCQGPCDFETVTSRDASDDGDFVCLRHWCLCPCGWRSELKLKKGFWGWLMRKGVFTFQTRKKAEEGVDKGDMDG